MKLAVMMVLVAVNTAIAFDGQTLEECALEILAGKPYGPQHGNVFFAGASGRTGSTTGYTIQQVRAITNRADVIAAAAAKKQAPQDVTIGKATLRTHADGSVELVSGPIIIAGSTNGAFEIWVDSETGLVLSTLDHASPRKTQADKDADKAKKKAQIAAVKAATTEKDKLAALLVLLGLEDAP